MEDVLTRVVDLLFLARQNGIEVVLNNERLQMKVAEDTVIDKGIVAQIRENKEAIIKFLSSNDWNAKKSEAKQNKIIPFNREVIKNIPLSYSQERLWFTDQLEGSVQYHNPAALRLTGNLNVEALSKALVAIVDRHEVLRTVFKQENGQPYQYIKPKGQWQLAIIEGCNYKNNGQELQKFIESLIQTPFDLAHDYMFRASLIVLSQNEHVLVVVMHHIASDAWSLPIIIKEIAKLYSAFSAGREAELFPLEVQYSDFSVWQRNSLPQEIFDQKVDYWKQKLEDVAPLLLPTDYKRPPVKTTAGAAANFQVNKDVLNQLHKISQQEGCSLYMTLLASFKVLLYRYTGQQDISVGTSVANRTQKEVEDLVGFFVNTLAFRDEVKGDSTFTELLNQVKATTLGAYEHQEVSFEKVVEVVLNERNPAISPLFQVMLVLKNTPEAPRLQLGELVLSAENYEHTISKFDLTFFINETPSGLQGVVQYRKDLFGPETIARMMSHFVNLLGSVVKDPLQKVGELPMLSAEEQQQLLHFNDKQVAYPADKTIVSLFEEQAQKTPTATAVVYEEEELTYEALNKKANQLAHYLRSRGVKEDTLVPVYVERSAALVTAILGILKAGAAYVPIDTDFPADRISYMLADSRSPIVISSKESSAKLETAQPDIEIIEIDGSALKDQPSENPQTALQPHHLAYVIYTSGSTGKPKGVMIEHRHLVDYVFGLNDQLQVDQCHSYALVSSIATDLGNTVIYSSLVFGGALHLFSKESVSNIEYLHNYFKTRKIDVLKIVPSHWKALSQDEELLLPKKLLVFGGEALQREVLEDVWQTGTTCKVVNHYGPTETTIGKLLHKTEAGRSYNATIPIGKPFSNTRVYVVSKELQLAPIGVPGQLYIAGHGVARGYLNNEELTRAKLITNPFSKEPNEAVMYGTGDLVKYLPDGNIEFIGRVDDQVKIRGYRVELGEIESILQQSELVSQAVVLAKDDKQGNKRLVGYIVPEGYFEREEILSYLKERLPEYMIPAQLLELESLPLTANGKVDRKALPDPESTEQAGDKYVAPRTPTEERLAQVWQNVLEEEQIGVNDDFFELGGHSLLAVRLVSAIRKEFAVEIPISHVFDYPTIALLASALEEPSEAAVLPSIEVANPRPEKIPLSFSQERLWFIDKLEGSVQYHVPAVVRLTGNLNIDALGRALQKIVERHEVLRTVFNEEDGKAFQVIQDNVSPVMKVINDLPFAGDISKLEGYINGIIAEPFNLSKDTMLRAHLLVLKEDDYILVVTIHHIASDGWSRSLLVGELAGLYEAFSEDRQLVLPTLPLQYADFSLWQRKYLADEILDKKLGYWKNKLEDVLPLNLPTDHIRPAVQGTRGGMIGFRIEKQLSAALLELSHKQGSTMYMTLLSAFNVLLYRYSNQEDISVGTPIAGRLQQELEGLIGFFVNTLTMRSRVESELTFEDLLEQVKATTLDAYANQEVPFEKVVEAVVKDRDTYRNPLFQVMFILRNTPDVPELHFGDVKLSRSAYEHKTSLFDVSLYLTETEHGLNGALEFSTELYERSTMEQMVAHFTELLTSIVNNPKEKVGLLKMVSDPEKNKLIGEFNENKAGLKSDKTVIELFEAQVELTPESTAVVFEKQWLSYQQLNERANQLAATLKEKGVVPETLVAICAERGLEMIIGILAILKAGGAFVPIDPEYPAERINYILEDIQAKIIITTQASKTKLSGEKNVEIVEIDAKKVVSNQLVNNLKTAASPQNLAYIIYTSGSTGQPKGVMVEHKGVTNTLINVSQELGFTASSSILSVTTFTFDIFYVEFFLPLITGGKLLIVPRQTAMDGFKLAESISNYHPTHIQGTPSTFQLLLESGWQNKEGTNILMGGEAIKEDIKEKLAATAKVWNGYGPTEATIYSTITQLQKGKKVLIGKPVPNTKVYIVSKDNQLCGIGIAGELCIAGAGLSRGYLNKAELTAEKFVEDPFSEVAGEKMYRTGDLARWVVDGELEYLGRIDFQVKIRGYRIELGEIESVLQQSGLVKEAIVIARQDADNNRLISYYTAEVELVKAKEAQLYQDQVSTWKDVYDIEYGQQDKELEDEEFDVGIWKDSFTGLNIPEEQMRFWVKDIAEVILAENAGKVLEIGCGTGLVFYQLAGKVDKYIGTDFSASSVNQIKSRISKGLKDYGPTELHVCAAHEIATIDEKVDTIVINSVVQYFPGENYMNDVIAKSISLLQAKGRIVIGDVRDKRLLQLFKGRLQLEKLQRSVGIKEFNWVVDQEVLKEEELCFSPDYFFHLKTLFPGITHVEITWKKVPFNNELSLYRYNVVLYVGIERTVENVKWQKWESIAGKGSIKDRIKNGEAVIALQDAPNFRLYKEQLLQEALSNNTINTVGKIIDTINTDNNDNNELGEIIEVAKANNYQFEFLLDENPLLINVIFRAEATQNFVANIYSDVVNNDTRSFTNIPLFTNISSLIQNDIRKLLLAKLPEYMVPADFIAVSRLPLTSSGKVDRLFLSSREDRGVVVNKYAFQAARTITEHKLSSIWQQLLSVDVISVHDNFFDLGGHSLLGMRLISAIRKELKVELSIKDLFTYPTIAALGTHLDLQSGGVLLPWIEAIELRPKKIPLSFSQERLWFLDRLEGSLQYHIPAVLRLKGSLNKEALSGALQAIVNRHEVLRTIFLEEEGRVYQHVKKADEWQLVIKEGQDFKEDETALQKYIQQLIVRPFILSQDDMLRAELIELDHEDCVLVLTLHHIASDGWSTSILVKELVELYEAIDTGKASRLTPLPIQYADFAIWQKNYLKDEVLTKKISYWNEKLSGVEPLELPVDYARPAIQSTKGATAGFNIDKDLTTRLQELSQKQGSTMFMTLLAAFKVLMFRHTGQQDICVGTPIAGRQQQEVEGLIGFFVNTLALRDEIQAESSFIEVIQQVKATTLDAYEHQDVPFEKVVDAVVQQRDMSRSPLFQVMFILQNAPDIPNLRLGDVKLSSKGSTHNTSKFDITFSITETSNGLRGGVEYAAELYKPETIERLVIHFKELIHSAVKEPVKSISLLPILTKGEEHQLLSEFNNTEVAYPKDKTIVDLFEEQSLKQPNHIAAVFEGRNLTYQQLNERANQLAHYLVSIGVKTETLVPVCIDRSLEMLVAVLGILKAGAAYVPIDPEYPAERISYMLEDTAANLVVSSKSSRLKIPGAHKLEVIEIDGEAELLATFPTTNPAETCTPDSLAYIIYTSGSTGKPKGVMIEHKNVVRLFKTEKPLFDFSEKDVWTMFHSFCFDFSVWEMYGALLFGGRLVMVPAEATKDVSLFCDLLSREKVTVLNQTPSAFYNLQDYAIEKEEPLSVRYVIFGGEALNVTKLQPWHEHYNECRLINMYGITETTVHVTYVEIQSQQIEAGKSVIGKPIPTLSVYVLDEHKNLVPTGVTSELHVGGAGLARGYLNRPELTSERFIADPFSQEAGARLYKTGDIGRRLADGNIEYLGRIDDQVKIRGFRIELGEIESVLQQSGLVKQAVVLAKEDKEGNKRLVGYVVGDSFDKEAAISFLESRLPGYMVPALWVQLESLPLTSNGKIDKQSLPDVDAGELINEQYLAPRNELEARLAEIWQQLLGVDLVGVNDNFFELGGHSLLVMRVVSSIRKVVGVEVAIKEIFNYPTIAQLATCIQDKSPSVLLPSIEVIEPRPVKIPLSFSQERLWFLDRLEGSLQYHIPAVLRLKGSLNKEALSGALQAIVNRHEVLRTIFLEEEGRVYQQVKKANEWQLVIKEGQDFKEDEIALQKYIQQLITRPFILSQDDMLRAELIELDGEDCVLVLTLHHIASDGWSTSILVKELVELYEAIDTGKASRLTPLPIQYADFAIWQKNYLKDEVLTKKISYWKEKLSGVAPLELAVDYARPAIQSTKGATAGFNIDKDLTARLQELSQKQGSTMFMTLLAAFKVLMFRYTGQQDICVGTPIAGRQQQEVEGLIGFFVNTLALRDEIHAESSFIQVIQQVKATTLDAYEHQDVPFEKVVDAVVQQRDMSRSPLFQVMFILQNAPDIPNLRLGDVKLSSKGNTHNTSKFDITFSITETSNGLRGGVEYAAELYKPETIERLVIHFKELIHSAVKEPAKSISLLPILTKGEEHQLLSEFNNTQVAYPKDKTIVDLFEEQSLKQPNHIAAVFEGRNLTYQQLNERANQLAHYLVSLGVKTETLVPVCIDRSLEMLVAVLGILKAGAAYVPIDPNYPEDRKNLLFEDISAKLVITNSESAASLRSKSAMQVIEIEDNIEVNGQPTYNLNISIRSSDAAYVIYTSGSTGKPKGTINEHQGIYNRLLWAKNFFNISDQDTILQKTPYTFDVSVWELLGSVISGSTLVFAKPEGHKDNDYLKQRILEENITILHFVPSMLEVFLADLGANELQGLRKVLCSGEALKPSQVELFIERLPGVELHNLYGPTEAAIDVTYWSLPKGIKSVDIVPIGKPVANTQLYILDSQKSILPIGVAGEIYIGGVQVGRGYLNMPEFTAERFTADFVSKREEGKLYKTGDIGRWLADGNIEYLGRIDDQVKIRGFRIELGEIESVLQQSGLVKQAVVLAKEDKEGNKRLVGYVVGDSFDKEAAISFLESRLPGYMVPALWVQLESLPLTSNGKIDKQSLPDVDAGDLVTSEYAAAQNDTEGKLVEIWQQLLRVEQVGINDNFFELGGQSLLAIRLVSAMNKELKAELSIKDLFLSPTVHQIAKQILGQKDKLSAYFDQFKSLVQIKRGGNKIPLYIISGGGGTVFKFKEFTDLLDANQPVFGLQQPFHPKDLIEFPNTIEGIAAYYIKEILIQNPTGPYALAGHCLGGIIAFEMAKQMESLGKKVELLSMFDTIIKERPLNIKKSFKNLYQIPFAFKRRMARMYLKIQFETYLFSRYTKVAVQYRVKKIRAFKNSFEKNYKPSDIVNLEKTFLNASRNYHLTPYDKDILVFYAKDHYLFLDQEKNISFKKVFLSAETKNMWSKYARSIKIYEIEGEHSTIFYSSQSKEFANLMQKELDKCN